MRASRIRQIIAWLQQMLPKVQSPVVKKPPKPKPPVKPFKPLFGVDGESSPSVKALNSAGIEFVIRYVSTAGNPKNITASEARKLKKAGKGIVIVFETTGTRALAGRIAGRLDARLAITQVNAVGLSGIPIYFAIDFEPTTTDLAPIAKYFTGVNEILVRSRVGAYGAFNAIRYLFEHKLIRYGYQTYAWSGGLRYTAAQLYQFSNDHTIGGVSVDFDRAYAADYGQYKP